jgi:phage terminase large subunit-like protein
VHHPRPPEWAIRTKSDVEAINQGAWWDDAKGDKLIAFAHTHFAPQFIAGKFRLLRWQERFLRSLISWRWASGSRRWRSANLHVAKKNGKTLLLSILSLYEILYSEEQSPYVAVCAATKANAEQIYREIQFTTKTMGLEEEGLVRYFDSKAQIKFDELNGVFKCFASAGKNIHGEPVSFACVDEAHATRDDSTYRALRYNTDARQKSGMIVVISTSGDDTSHWYKTAMYDKSKRVLAGEEIDLVHYAEVYEADPKKDYENDPAEWAKANPSLQSLDPNDDTFKRYSFPLDQFARDLKSAKLNIGDWLNFCRLKLNLWVRPSENAWLDTQSDWCRYRSEFSYEDLKYAPAHVGVDLSEVADPTSISIIFCLPGKKFFIKSHAFVCEKGIQYRSKTNLPKFAEFVEQGCMTRTDGDMIDRNAVFEYLMELCRQWDVRSVNFDPHGAFIMANDVEQEGYVTKRVRQSHADYHPIMVEFANAYKDGRILHDGSGWQGYSLSNIRVDIDRYGRMRPHRGRSVDYIDGGISTLVAFATALGETETKD